MKRLASARRTVLVTAAHVADDRHRRGFTLVEMLVALALSAVVISSVYGAIHLQWKVRTAGEARVDLARRAQGAVLDLTFDLRGCRRPVVAVGENNSSTASTESATTNGIPHSELFPIKAPEITERVLQFDSLPENVRLIEFVGRSDAMMLTIDRGNSRFPSTGSEVPIDSARQVCWFLNSGRNVRIPYGISEPHRYQAEMRSSAVPHGLVRVELPVSPEAFTRQMDVTPENSSWTVVDDSVATVRLRYFDGATWQSSWDSSESTQLPIAVEVSLSHRHDAPSRTEFSSAETASVVIRIPQAGGVR
jgi:prepilin-type N-terminal cleavage/methylation domain-containing protein